jgi:DNA-binding transcriptional ArsR family regulator
MARAATTSDAFNAVAEPRRRQILSYLAHQERPVGHIAKCLRLDQPSVSKHLRVLKEVGLVSARRNGRQILYKTNAESIQAFMNGPKRSRTLGDGSQFRSGPKRRAHEDREARPADRSPVASGP